MRSLGHDRRPRSARQRVPRLAKRRRRRSSRSVTARRSSSATTTHCSIGATSSLPGPVCRRSCRRSSAHGRAGSRGMHSPRAPTPRKSASSRRRPTRHAWRSPCTRMISTSMAITSRSFSTASGKTVQGGDLVVTGASFEKVAGGTPTTDPAECAGSARASAQRRRLGTRAGPQSGCPAPRISSLGSAPQSPLPSAIDVDQIPLRSLHARARPFGAQVGGS